MYTRECVICGKTFESNQYQTKFCSQECKKEGMRLCSKRAHERIKQWKKERKERPCEICGAIFLPETPRTTQCDSCTTNTYIQSPIYEEGKRKKRISAAQRAKLAKERDRALSEKVGKARELGVSYGTYVAMLEGRLGWREKREGD